MCGVAGSIGQIDPRRVDTVQAMTRAQSHRGPDDEGMWSAQSGDGRGVVLGHRHVLDAGAEFLPAAERG